MQSGEPKVRGPIASASGGRQLLPLLWSQLLSGPPFPCPGCSPSPKATPSRECYTPCSHLRKSLSSLCYHTRTPDPCREFLLTTQTTATTISSAAFITTPPGLTVEKPPALLFPQYQSRWFSRACLHKGHQTSHGLQQKHQARPAHQEPQTPRDTHSHTFWLGRGCPGDWPPTSLSRSLSQRPQPPPSAVA